MLRWAFTINHVPHGFTGENDDVQKLDELMMAVVTEATPEDKTIDLQAFHEKLSNVAQAVWQVEKKSHLHIQGTPFDLSVISSPY